MRDDDRPVRRPSRAWVLVLALVPVPLLVTVIVDASAVNVVLALVASTLFAVIAALVWAIQGTRRQRDEFETRLAEWAGERAVEGERLRIARDLHDLTSHGLGVITMRAAAATSVQGIGEEELHRALVDIETVSRRATGELRSMLALLRGDGEAPLRPLDRLSVLPEVIDEAERGGLRVGFDVTVAGTDGELGDLADLDPECQLTVCTVVREGLANAARHAGPTSVAVAIRTCGQAPEAIEVEVRDDGPLPGWVGEPGAGVGLVGLRERLGAVGGTLEARRDGPGFLLRALVPSNAGRGAGSEC